MGPAAPRSSEVCCAPLIWALDRFTADNGATQVIPRSYLWGDAAPPPDAAEPGSICMSAGSVLVLAGTLMHRGGASRGPGTRLGVTPQYCQPWLRRIENLVLAVPPQLARNLSPRGQELLGYSIVEPSFMGYVNGLHPKRLIDPDDGQKLRVKPA